MIAALRRLYARLWAWLATDPGHRDDPDDWVW